jgi:hypothetical protein
LTDKKLGLTKGINLPDHIVTSLLILAPALCAGLGEIGEPIDVPLVLLGLLAGLVEEV